MLVNGKQLELSAKTEADLAELGIDEAAFLRIPRGRIPKQVSLRPYTLGELKKIIDSFPPDAVLDVERKDEYSYDSEGLIAEEYSVYDLVVKWEEDDTDEAWAEEVLRTVRRERFNAERADAEEIKTYKRLQQKYGDLHEVHLSELNDEAKRLREVKDLWPVFKANCLKHGVKIIGEDEC